MSMAAIIFLVLTIIFIAMFVFVVIASITDAIAGDPAIIFVLYISLIAGIVMCGCATYWEVANAW